jgi:hypothetical protein
MDMKRTFVWALIAMPLLAACNDDEKVNNDDNQTPAQITMQDITGAWHLTLVSADEVDADTLIIKPDGQYQYSYTLSPIEEGQPIPFYQQLEDGELTTINGNLVIDNVTMSKERYATITDIEHAWWDTLYDRIGKDTTRISLYYGGSVMVQEYFNGPVTPTSKDVRYISMFFKQRATNLPSDKSALQGTWYWKEKGDDVTVAVRFSGDSVEVYLGRAKASLLKGACTFKDGIVAVGKTTKYVSRDADGNDVINPNNPFDAQWQPIDTAKEDNFYEDGLTFAFIVNGRTAYSQFALYSPIFIKQ